MRCGRLRLGGGGDGWVGLGGWGRSAGIQKAWHGMTQVVVEWCGVVSCAVLHESGCLLAVPAAAHLHTIPCTAFTAAQHMTCA
jgi:hypothetical protein